MNVRFHTKVIRLLFALAMLAAATPALHATGTGSADGSGASGAPGATGGTGSSGAGYQQRNLASDGTVPADNTDSHLVNAWGLAFNPYAYAWVANAGDGVSTLYDGNGKAQPLVVKIPTAANSSGLGKPTGIVYSGSPNGFIVQKDGASGPARFIFATEDGTIAAWAPDVDMNNAIRMVDNFVSSGAIYKGLALSAVGYLNTLYAADFHNNKIDVFVSTFVPAVLAESAFKDPQLPAGFAPFGIQAINGDIYVAYAKQDSMRADDVPGQGLGYINVFTPNGTLIKRLVSGGELNAPWGMALAPAGFGKFGGRLLVGNFGDGTIHAYDLATGEHVGVLENVDGQAIRIEGLWGIAFGNGFQNQPVDTLFFTAGPNDEAHGLYGRIDAVSPDSN